MLPLTATTDWVSAVGGILTTLIALYLLGQGQVDRAKKVMTERRAQAAKITLSGGQRIRGRYWGGGDGPGEKESVSQKFTLTNRSLDVISDVILEARWQRLTAPRVGEEGAGSEVLARLDGDSEEIMYLKMAVLTGTADDPFSQDIQIHQLSLTFTDAAGVRWERDLRHVLREVVRVPPRPGRLGYSITRFERWRASRREDVKII